MECQEGEEEEEEMEEMEENKKLKWGTIYVRSLIHIHNEVIFHIHTNSRYDSTRIYQFYQ